MKDQKEPPLERTLYWIEYVIRHNGASHLRSAALDLNWFQYHLIDVHALLITIVTVILISVIVIVKKLVKFIFNISFKLFSGQYTKFKLPLERVNIDSRRFSRSSDYSAVAGFEFIFIPQRTSEITRFKMVNDDKRIKL